MQQSYNISFFLLRRIQLSYILAKIEFWYYHILSFILDNFMGEKLHFVLNCIFITFSHLLGIALLLHTRSNFYFSLILRVVSFIDDLESDTSQDLASADVRHAALFTQHFCSCCPWVPCSHFQLHSDSPAWSALYGTHRKEREKEDLIYIKISNFK